MKVKPKYIEPTDLNVDFMSYNSTFVIGIGSLVIQIVVFAVLILGLYFKKQNKLRLHGFAMAFAVFAHLVSIVAVMVPSFRAVTSTGYMLPEPQMLFSALGAVHALAGTLAFVLGLWMVVAWRFRQNVGGCMKRKKFMLVTAAFWMLALVLGFVLFGAFYGPMF